MRAWNTRARKRSFTNCRRSAPLSVPLATASVLPCRSRQPRARHPLSLQSSRSRARDLGHLALRRPRNPPSPHVDDSALRECDESRASGTSSVVSASPDLTHGSRSQLAATRRTQQCMSRERFGRAGDTAPCDAPVPGFSPDQANGLQPPSRRVRHRRSHAKRSAIGTADVRQNTTAHAEKSATCRTWTAVAGSPVRRGPRVRRESVITHTHPMTHQELARTRLWVTPGKGKRRAWLVGGLAVAVAGTAHCSDVGIPPSRPRPWRSP
jgi:hypothetical protein